MHAQSMPNMKEEAIEDQLHILWRTLPARGVTDPEGMLSDYLFALKGVSLFAIENVVNELRAGLVEDASKEFCPKAPKLGELVRAEQRRIEILNAPRPIPYQSVPHEFNDWRITHRQKADDLKAAGWKLVAENMSLDDFVLGGKRRRLRTGTVWLWAVAEAWSPPVEQREQA